MNTVQSPSRTPLARAAVRTCSVISCSPGPGVRMESFVTMG